MPRQPPPRPGSARTRTPIVLGALLVLALVMPGLALASDGSSTARSAGVPSCTHFSLAAMAHTIGVPSLEFQGAGPVGNTCLYKSPHMADHYADLLTVSLAATPDVVFLRARQRARYSPVQHQQAFGTINRRGVQAFFVITGYSSQGLGACRSPGAPLPEFGPPLCEGQPGWYTYGVYSYGTLGRKGPKVFVSVALAGEPVIGSLATVESLDKKIHSGQIR